MAATSPPSASGRVASQPAGAWAWLVATFFGVGQLPLPTGTWGSAAAVPPWRIVSRWITVWWQAGTVMGLAVLATLVGIPAATWVERETGRKAPQFVVIDEVAGQASGRVA